MNLQQAKALFFAQYLRKEICITSVPVNINYPNYPFDINERGLFLSGVIGGEIIIRRIAEDIKDRFNQCSLLLRSIDKLTDEEAINLATIVIENPFNRYRNIEVTRNYAITGFPYISVHHKNVRQRFEIDCTHFNFSVYDMGELDGSIDMKPYACIDYLRSIGIILPFTYLNEENKLITLQPDEIIKLGWAKIKDNV